MKFLKIDLGSTQITVPYGEEKAPRGTCTDPRGLVCFVILTQAHIFNQMQSVKFSNILIKVLNWLIISSALTYLM